MGHKRQGNCLVGRRIHAIHLSTTTHTATKVHPQLRALVTENAGTGVAPS